MRRTTSFLLLAALAIGMASCSGSTEKKTAETAQTEVAETAKVIVYYFHGKQRCKTCLTIQEVAGKTIAENFVDNNDVLFAELDYSEKVNEAIAERYEVANSSLFVVSGDEFVNLTDIAFANALRNPVALSDALTAEVNNFLTK